MEEIPSRFTPRAIWAFLIIMDSELNKGINRKVRTMVMPYRYESPIFMRAWANSLGSSRENNSPDTTIPRNRNIILSE